MKSYRDKFATILSHILSNEYDEALRLIGSLYKEIELAAGRSTRLKHLEDLLTPIADIDVHLRKRNMLPLANELITLSALLGK